MIQQDHCLVSNHKMSTIADGFRWISILSAILFLIPTFRQWEFASLFKGFPMIFLAFHFRELNTKQKDTSNETKHFLSFINLALLISGLGDVYLHNNMSGIFAAAWFFYPVWIIYLCLLYNSSYNGVGQSNWRESFVTYPFYFVIIVVISTLYLFFSNFKMGDHGLKVLLIVPYAILQVICFVYSLLLPKMRGQNSISTGIFLFLLSDVVICFELIYGLNLCILTWPLYFVAQVLIAVGLRRFRSDLTKTLKSK